MAQEILHLGACPGSVSPERGSGSKPNKCPHTLNCIVQPKLGWRRRYYIWGPVQDQFHRKEAVVVKQPDCDSNRAGSRITE